MSVVKSRREFLATGAVAFLGMTTSSTARAASPKIEVLERRVISWKPPLYHGWPTLARRKNGELLLVFSGGRERHVCPFGRVELMRSHDDGQSWCWPQVLLDGPIDDRDAGVVETANGSLLVTTFTSLAYEATLQKMEKAAPVPGPEKAEHDKLLAEWRAAHGRISAEQRQQELGTWMIRSTDGGVTWSARYAVPLNSPHGPVVLREGRLIYAGKALWKDDRIGVCESKDDGLTWDWLATIPARTGDDPKQYHELHAVEAADGTLLAHIRNHNRENAGETLQSESTDGGRTWSVPHSIGVWGLPSHLLRLRDGRLLMSYGHRRAPIGNLARVSADHGRSWSEPLTISADAKSGDMGYPSTVECADGTLVTVWYELLADSPNAQLRQARWRLW
ncbi:MAG: sialidase family protein [Planctomycetaceae bacterium]